MYRDIYYYSSEIAIGQECDNMTIVFDSTTKTTTLSGETITNLDSLVGFGVTKQGDHYLGGSLVLTNNTSIVVSNIAITLSSPNTLLRITGSCSVTLTSCRLAILGGGFNQISGSSSATDVENTGNLFLYNCFIYSTGINGAGTFWRLYRSGQLGEIKNCLFSGWHGIRIGGTFIFTKNKIINATNSTSPITTKGNGVVLSNNEILDSDAGFYWATSPSHGGSATVANHSFTNCSVGVNVSTDNSGNGATLTASDWDIDENQWTFQFNSTLNTQFCTIRRVYKYDFKCVSRNGDLSIPTARIAIVDSNGSVVTNTLMDTNAELQNIYLIHGEYYNTTGNIITPFTPHTITVRAYGFIQDDRPETAKLQQGVKQIELLQNADVIATAPENITGIIVDPIANTVVLNEGNNIHDVYDYLQWWGSTETGIRYLYPLTKTGNNYSSSYDWHVNGALTGSGVIDLGANVATFGINGSSTLPIQDINGIRFRIAGLPTTGTVKVRLHKLSDNTKTYYQADASGELYVQLPLNETYELRADDLGYYGVRGIQFNTGLQSFVTVTLEPVQNYTYGLGAPTEKALYTVDPVTLQISIAYDPSYPTLSWQAAVDVLEDFYSSNIGLDAEHITRYSQNVIQFAEDTSVTIVPDANNAANVTLGYLVTHENRAAPHALFPDTIAPRILYDVVQNVAVFTGEVTATTDNAAIAGAVWSNTTRTLTEAAGGASLTDIENSAVLAKEATLATKASQASVNAIPLNPLLTDDLRLNGLSNLDVTVSSRLAATTYTAAPTTAAIATAVESQLADDFAGITIDLTPVNTELARLTALLEPTGGGDERLSASALSQTPLVDLSGLATASQMSLLNNLSQSQVEAAATAAIVAYAPPTRTEAASDRDTIISALPGEPPTPDSISRSVWLATTRSLTVPSGLTSTQATQLTNLDLRLTDTRALNLDNLDATVSSRLDSSSYATPPSTAAIASAVWVNVTRELTQTVATLTLAEIEGSTVLAMKSDVSGFQSFITPYLNKIHTIWTGNGFDPTNPISALAPNAITPGWIRAQDLSVDQTHVQNNDNSYTLSSNV